MGLLGTLFSEKLDSLSAEKLADALVMGDVAPDIAEKIVGKIKASDNPKGELSKILVEYAKKLEGLQPNPKTILVVGVNGAGKTTTIGKLAKRFIDAGRPVVIGACDTFRAAANEQLDAWATRAGARIVHGGDPSAVAYKTVESAGEEEVVILDTAGRMHNRDDLMQELSKINRVVKKIDAALPVDVWLVLDGTAGQNALLQIEYFNRAVPLTGLVVTKMDGTSRGGFLIGYAAREKNPLSVAYVGCGENIGDIRPFNAGEYVDKLLA
jgi:fused signal recognition particle receptor